MIKPEFDLFLIRYSYLMALILFILLLLTLFYNLKDISRLCSSLKKKYLLALLGIFAASLLIRLFIAPHKHYVFYDEYEHVNIAKNMADDFKFARCNMYLGGKCLAYDLPQWGPGYHFLLSLAFGVFGTSETVAYNFNVITGALSVILMFYTVFLISGSQWSALAAAAFLGALPLHVKFSGSSSQEITSLFFMLLSIFAMLAHEKLGSRKSLFMFFAVVAYLALVRPENGILAYMMTIYIFTKKPDHPAPVWLIVACEFLFIPYIMHLLNIHRYFSRWMTAQTHSGGNLLLANISFWLRNQGIPLTYMFFACIGLYYVLKKIRGVGIFLASYFLIFILFYTYYHRINISISDFQRFNIQFCIPVIVFSGYGLYFLSHYAGKAIKLKWLLPLLFFVIIGLSVSLAVPYVESGMPGWDFQAQHRLLLKGKGLDEKCALTSYNTASIITVLDRPCIHVSYLLDDNFYEAHLKDSCLIFVNDYWAKNNSGGIVGQLEHKFSFLSADTPPPAGEDIFYLLRKKVRDE
ncbi:MAG: glycosyltransferase family 39 protein [Candidatus Omnitrophica bacterium]|nr:glycosyltransferase family 39 protein [Candidatus Omnitrophota bacterium]